jgi:hypothetical protein
MKGLFFFFICTAALPAAGQHQHHVEKAADSARMEIDTMQMSHAFSRNLPMSRNGSGTGWMPDATVMYGHGKHTASWMWMFHANLFMRYNKQDIFGSGQRGGEKFDAPNWFMGMGQRKTGKRGLFRFSAMLSLDPVTIGGSGYPLLFQSGEVYNGKRLVDRQHPHDLFSELSVAYTHMVSKDLDITGYLGYPGEPALGPVAFMHRNSALNNPDAPLSHHWQDATHITFGVATLGIRYKIFKLEGSSFTGREPDEGRYGFDEPRFDSYALRLQCNPARNTALQVSRAYLNSPEIADRSENIDRTTASVINHVPLNGENRYVATTITWGLNESDHEENSFLAEPLVQLDKTAVYGRYEWIEKSAGELDLEQFSEHAAFKIQSITLGANRTFFRKAGNNAAIGIQGTLFIPDDRLTFLYGEMPCSVEIYLRFFPHTMHMHQRHKH